MLRVIICPDSFKGSLSAIEAAQAMNIGVRNALSDVAIDMLPLADGGEGTVETLINALGGNFVELTVQGPLQQPVTAHYGILADRMTAVIEMATASGFHLVPEEQRNPLITTTYGVGELILDAYERGVRKFIIGIGGSVTNDGGAGALSALGVRFLDEHGCELPLGGASLVRLAKIDTSGIKVSPEEMVVRVACDVSNPLTGSEGASAVYGPQKGATHEMVMQLDLALRNYADHIKSEIGADIDSLPGAGAAGGLGAGLAAFLGAKLESGIDIVLDVVDFDHRASQADLIITGEGCVDRQTIYGKTIAGVLNHSHNIGVPVIILAGTVGEGTDALLEAGAVAVMSIAPGPITPVDSMNQAARLLSTCTENVVRIFSAGCASKQPGTHDRDQKPQSKH